MILNLFGFISFWHTEGMLAWGIAFVVLAILIYLQNKANKSLVFQSFMIQFSFALIVLGKTFILFYALNHIQNYFKFHSTWLYSGVLLVLTLATFFFYRIRFERFLGCFFLFLSIMYNITETPFFGEDKQLVLNLFLLFQVFLASLFVLHPHITSNFTPISYALIVSVAVEIVFYDLAIAPWLLGKYYGLEVAQYGFAFLLIIAIFWASGARNIGACLQKVHLIVASLATILLAYLTAPGIIFSIFLIILGYASQRHFLWLFGLFLMPVYLYFYYSSLQVSLLDKSIIMFSSGVLLLLGAAYTRLFQLDKVS
jgi:hypothetical protein